MQPGTIELLILSSASTLSFPNKIKFFLTKILFIKYDMIINGIMNKIDISKIATPKLRYNNKSIKDEKKSK